MHMHVSAVSVEEAAEKIHDTGTVLVDVRTLEEYAAGHARGALNIPQNKILYEADRLAQYDTVYLMCQSGGRSAQAVAYLALEGIHAVNVTGGIDAWRAAGLEME